MYLFLLISTIVNCYLDACTIDFIVSSKISFISHQWEKATLIILLPKIYKTKLIQNQTSTLILTIILPQYL